MDKMTFEVSKNDDGEEFDRTLTPEEIAAPDYLDWSDETLARCLRHLAKKIRGKPVETWEHMTLQAAVMVLVRFCIDVNARKLTEELDLVVKGGGEGEGTWRVTIQKITTRKKAVR